MAWDTLKDSILRELTAQVDSKGEKTHRDWLHHLAKVFFGRFAGEDLRGRSVENIYGCLYGLLHFIQSRPDDEPRARIFNPELSAHGWESKNTVIVILCRDMSFSTSSIRGELNRRGIRVHTVASCNLAVTRDEQGDLTRLLNGDGATDTTGVSRESLIYFEVGRHSNLEKLEELREALCGILTEVAVVVDDFPAMQERVTECITVINTSTCVNAESRDEAAEFIRWLAHYHMTFLGYEYIDVSRAGADVSTQVNAKESLGLLRLHSSSGVRDLKADIQACSCEELQNKQLSFSKSRTR